MKNSEAINTVWEALQEWCEDSLGGRVGVGNTDEGDDDYAEEWSAVCEAMSHIQIQLIQARLAERN